MSPATFPARQISQALLQLPVERSLALVFPGQGSQKAGMGARVRYHSPVAAEVYKLADEAIGSPLADLCFNGPDETLTLTSNAQPAILSTSLAILGSAIESGALAESPACVAGHSLGQYSALVAAGAMRPDDAVRLVRRRGRLMHEAGAVHEGTLAAIVSLDQEAVEAICHDSGAEVANYNAPGQTVVGGPPGAVESACALAKERGGRGIPINVSGAFHTSLMSSAAEQFAPALEQVQIADPLIPVLGNVTARPLRTADEVREDLLHQVKSPVRWHQSMSALEEMGIKRVIEIGPGRVLTAQLKRSNPALQAVSLDEDAALPAGTNV
jgi:[acyl-carrier-protein] S-malonyltransferase